MRIRKNIFRNLRTRFNLDVTPPIDLAPTVQLVSQVDPLLTKREIVNDEADATALTSYFDVPDDEKWTVLWVSMYSAQSHNMSCHFYAHDTDGPFLTVLRPYGTSSYTAMINRIDLMPGWGMQFLTLAGTTGAIRHTAYVEKQKWAPYVEK